MAGTPQGNGRVVLRVVFKGIEEAHSFLPIDAWMPEVQAIWPTVGWLMRQIEGSRCVAGHEPAVKLALQEALNKTVVHGNRMDRDKVVHIRCRCEFGTGRPLSSQTSATTEIHWLCMMLLSRPPLLLLLMCSAHSDDKRNE